MPKPYSLDLRERAVAAVNGGESRRAVAKLFQVSPSVVIRWVQQFTATGSAAAKPMGGSRRDALGEQGDWLRERLAEKPDLTLDALRLELVERGVRVSLWTIWNFCRTEKLTFKKKACCPVNSCAVGSPAGDRVGSACNPSSSQNGLSLLMKPGRKRT
jgi:transposase